PVLPAPGGRRPPRLGRHRAGDPVDLPVIGALEQVQADAQEKHDAERQPPAPDDDPALTPSPQHALTLAREDPPRRTPCGTRPRLGTPWGFRWGVRSSSGLQDRKSTRLNSS